MQEDQQIPDYSFLNNLRPMGREDNSAPYLLATHFETNREKPYLSVRADWRCDQDAIDTYYNVLCWTDADENGTLSGSGYAGFQNVNGAHVVIFSLWGTHEGYPTVEWLREGGRQRDFDGEGEGKHTMIRYEWEVGKWYTMQIDTELDGGKTKYIMWIKPEDGEWQCISSISFPKTKLGFTNLQSFLEDWRYNGLERADSLKNIQVLNSDMKWVDSSYCTFNHWSSNMFREKNNTLKCTYSVSADGVISLRISGENITDAQTFPAAIHQ